MVRAEPQNIVEHEAPIEEELAGFDLDTEELEQESQKIPLDKSEPIVETVSSHFSLDDDELDKPAFLRKGEKISDHSDDNDDMPSFIKRKL
ncbi:hypothetical protein H0W80_04320 [Candidatus Saccharibacteria bacterium]|nr:hypothetical protein [Candidatus Saccharibacteria bacterium]